MEKSEEKKGREEKDKGKKDRKDNGKEERKKVDSKKRDRKPKGKTSQQTNQSDFAAQTALFNEKLNVLNGKIDLINQKETLLSKSQKKNVKKNLNKEDNYPFESYEKCFLAKAIKFTKLLLPTALIRIECEDKIFGPFRALLDTGAQPTLISHTLFKSFKCSTSQTGKKLLGVASVPVVIKRKLNVIIRPWFDSDVCIDDTLWVLPHEDTWKPMLPSTELKVHRKDFAFRQTLADPEYFIPKEVHLLLGISVVARMLEYKIQTEIDGTTLFHTSFGNVVMGEHVENWEELADNEHMQRALTVVDDNMEQKLHGMIERLWK